MHRWKSVALTGVLTLAPTLSWAGAPPDAEAEALACIERAESGEDVETAMQCLLDSGVEMSDAVRESMVAVVQSGSLGDAAEWDRAVEQAVIAQARSLAAQDDVEHLLQAVLLVPPGMAGPGQAVELADRDALQDGARRAWLERARELGPDDPLVAWMEVAGAIPAGDLEREAALQRLLRLQADNLAVQLRALDAASRAGDPVAVRTHLRLAAEAPHWRTADQVLVPLLREALGQVELPPLPAEVGQLFATLMGSSRVASGADLLALRATHLSAILTAPYAGLARECSLEAAGEDRLRRGDCERVLARLAEDDASVLHRSLGLNRLVELSAGTPDNRHWRDRLRRYSWVYEQVMPLIGDTRGGFDQFAYTADMVEHGEWRAWLRLLETHGIPAQPPTGWSPRDPHRRARVTGQPPAP